MATRKKVLEPGNTLHAEEYLQAETQRKVNSKGRFMQGYYTPQNPEKYVGDLTKIRYMSSWELNFNKFLDGNPNILRWSSENIAIPYIKPTDGRIHKYYPDYWIEFRDLNGVIHQELIEIKPKKQTELKRNATTYDRLTYAINESKWKACKTFCDQRGIKFRIVTEESLFGLGVKK